MRALKSPLVTRSAASAVETYEPVTNPAAGVWPVESGVMDGAVMAPMGDEMGAVSSARLVMEWMSVRSAVRPAALVARMTTVLTCSVS